MEPMRRMEGDETVPDEELVRMVRAGAFASFEGLMRRHARRVHHAIRAILRQEADVEDAVQQTFLQAFVAIGRFEGASSFSTWVTRIAVNEALMRARRARWGPVVVPPDPDGLAFSGSGPEQQAAAREEIRLVRQAALRLPPRHRELFRLRYVEGLSVTQAATRLEITEAAAKLRLSRTRQVLRRAIGMEERTRAHAPDRRRGPESTRLQE
jgi:RNA polymerase sigma-70 factor (ECF subfamily)